MMPLLLLSVFLTIAFNHSLYHHGRVQTTAIIPRLPLRTTTRSTTLTGSDWFEMDGCLVLFPATKRVPKAIIHFIGGFLAGSSVQIGYASLLGRLCDNEYLVIATPIPALDRDHSRVSKDVTRLFIQCYNNSMRPLFGPLIEDIPVVGLSHSLGGKLTVLVNSNLETRKSLPKRAANVFLAFNNYDLQQSLEAAIKASKVSSEVGRIVQKMQSGNIPQLLQSLAQAASVAGSTSSAGQDFLNAFDRLGGAPAKDSKIGGAAQDFGTFIRGAIQDMPRNMSSLEFEPSSNDTWALLLRGYNVQSNYLFKFRDDDIDQSPEAAVWLRRRGCDVRVVSVPGNHITPNSILPSLLTATNRYQPSPPRDQEFLDQLLACLNRISFEASDAITERNNEKYYLRDRSSSNQSGDGNNR